MELIRGIHNLRQEHRGCVLTIGNFDGVHRGHQELLHRLKMEGRRLQLPVMVMIFEPQPAEVLATSNIPARLTHLRDKYRYLALYGVDKLLCIKFDRDFAAITAQSFITELLVQKLGVRYLVVGDDFRFGAKRQGDYSLLVKAGRAFGFSVMDTESICEQGVRISSTMVRDALGNDDLRQAEKYLKRAFSISGRVVHGNELGRTIGFPTANILLKRKVSPIHGVYIVKVSGLGEKILPGVANIGTRPTVEGKMLQLEVYLLDFNENIYGRHLTVELCEKLRDEQRFASINELKQQIKKDVLASRQYFA